MKTHKRNLSITPYLFLLPFILSFCIFFAIPAIHSLVLSFFQYKGYGSMKFIGLENYASLLTYRTFWMSLRNTFFYFIVHTVFVMVFSFGFAYMLQSKALSFSHKIYKPILFLPQIVPIVASALIWRILFATQYGAINQFLGTNINFLGDYVNARFSVVLVLVWRAVGWYMIIFLAGLTTINDEVSDASKIDGANTFQHIVHIVLPMMKPILLFAFVMDGINSFKLFSEPNVLLNSGMGILMEPETIPVMNIIASNINGGNFGMASATGWIIFVLVLILTALQFWISKDRKD